MTNTNLLKEKIKSRGIKQQFIAEKLNITNMALINKLSDKTEFKASEIKKIKDILSLTSKEINDIFFTD